MQTQNGFQTLPAPIGYNIGSFRVTELQRERFSAALSIARQMRVEGEGHLEDSVRAMIILRGGAYLGDDWEMMEAEDEEDYDRQVVAYYDGVGELMRFLDGEQPHTHLCATGGSC
jgi:hypothetical protein